MQQLCFYWLKKSVKPLLRWVSADRVLTTDQSAASGLTIHNLNNSYSHPHPPIYCSDPTFNKNAPIFKRYSIKRCYVYVKQYKLQTLVKKVTNISHSHPQKSIIVYNYICKSCTNYFIVHFLVSVQFFLLVFFQAEKMFKQAFKVAEANYRKSQQSQHQNSTQEALHREYWCCASQIISACELLGFLK